MRSFFCRFCIVCFISGNGLGASIAAAQAPRASDVLAETFAQLPIMAGAQLSPDGNSIAFLSSLQGRIHLVIERFRPTSNRTIVPPIEMLHFDWVRWANNDRLVFAMSFSARRYLSETTETRLLAVDPDGQNLEMIVKPATRVEVGSRIAKELPPPQVQDDVIDWIVDDPDHILISVDADFDGAREVRRVNVRNGDYKIDLEDFAGIRDWVVDQTGEVRVGFGYRNEEMTVWTKNGEGEWGAMDWFRQDFYPVAFTENPTIAYVKGPNESGISVIRKMNIETGQVLETIFEHDYVDADRVVFDIVTGRPAGVAYTEHMPAVHFFDPTLSKLQRSIDRAIPDMTNQITSMSDNRKQLLIFSFSDTHPGAYYLWDREAKSLDHFSDSLPKLPVEALSAVKAITYKARDGLQIPGYLTVPKDNDAAKLPTVILPHGGPQARDDKRFWFLTQFLASRGYAVLQPNFRGSSGYGRDFADAGVKEWGGKMQDDVTDGARWLINEGIADPERLCIVGWSYGGYSAAMGAVKTPDLYKCAASINGVLNLVRHIEDDKEYIGGRAWTRHMGLDGENSKAVSPYDQAERINIPLLIIQSSDDSRVHKNQGLGMANKLKDLGKPVEYIEIEFGGHSMTTDHARLQILQALEKFLALHIGASKGTMKE